MLIVAVPSATSELIRELSGLAVDCGLDVRVLPPVEDLLAVSKVSLSDIRPVTEVDLLDDTRSTPSRTDLRVPFGSAGSGYGRRWLNRVGALSADCVFRAGRTGDARPRRVGSSRCAVVDRGRALLSTRSLVVCDIRDQLCAHGGLFRTSGPKSCSMLRLSSTCRCLRCGRPRPSRPILSALRMSWMRPRASVQYMFVNISTDKAADPAVSLGFTKRVAERITAASAAAPRHVSECPIRKCAGQSRVRFDDIPSSGRSWGSDTVTHPDVTRYFMTVEEAVQLVIQAGAVGRSGEVLVLDMGNPVRINEVAERLASEAPEAVDIVYTGLRPGEKLHETLFGIGEVDDDRSSAHLSCKSSSAGLRRV